MAASTPDFMGLSFTPEVRDDPYPLPRSLRETMPVAQTPFGWLLTRHADCSVATRDPKLSNDVRNAARHTSSVAEGGGAKRDSESTFMLFLDPPDHTRLRGLVSRAFTPRTVERLRARVSELVDGILDAVLARRDGAMDVIVDLAYPLPAIIICELLGVPAQDRGTLQDWSRALAASADPTALITAEHRAQIDAAERAFADYFTELIDQRRRAPAADLLSALIAVERAGERLSQRELLTMALLLFFAGHETTASLIGNATVALLRNRGQLTRLHDDPSLAGNAIEELLRFDSPVQLTQRFTLDDYEIGGVCIPPGQQVILLLGAANRDPDAFQNPDRLDLGREGAPRHLAFGGGPHFCLGSALARIEAEIAIAALVQRFPAMDLAAAPTRRPTITIRGYETLPIVTGPTAT